MKTLAGIASLVALLGCATSSATIIQGTSLQTRLAGAGAAIDVHSDQSKPDEVWAVGSSTIGPALLLFELAAYRDQNSFGIYDVTSPATQLTIFSGANGAGSTGALQLADASTHQFCAGLMWTTPSCTIFGSNLFGFFLSTPNGIFYSETARNGDGIDHMVAYQGGEGRGSIWGNPWLSNEFILAWEDLYGGGDRDYDDFAVLVESVIAVAEPGILALFAAAVLGLGLVRRRPAALA